MHNLPLARDLGFLGETRHGLFPKYTSGGTEESMWRRA